MNDYAKTIRKLTFPKNTWYTTRQLGFTSENFKLLQKNKIPCVSVKNFLNNSECEKLMDAAKRMGLSYYEGVYPQIGKIGATQFEYSGKKSSDYFKEAALESEKRKRINDECGLDPVKKVIEYFSLHGMNLKVAEDSKTGEKYYAGLYRIFEPGSSALLHFDYAPFDAKGWAIEKVKYQIAFNIYLKLPSSGGQLVVFNKPWNKAECEKYRLEGAVGSYGFSEKMVESNEKIEIFPENGDLVFFNSRNFHCVRPGNEHRFSISSFIGKTDSKKSLLLWN
jgi:hypothetical protein